MLEKLEGVVIRTQDYGETHKIVTLLTGKMGKIAVIARGAKKPKSRMSAVSQTFIQGEYLIQTGRGLGVMQQGEVIQSHRKIREDLFKTAYASYLAELADKLTDEKTPNAFIYKEFVLSLQAIEKDKDQEVIAMMFEMKLYDAAGFSPVLNRCNSCGTTDSLIYFSVHGGGVLCNECGPEDRYAVKINEKAIKLLQIFANISLEKVNNISIKSENKKLLRQLLDDYLQHHGGVYIKSKRFLSQLDQFLD